MSARSGFTVAPDSLGVAEEAWLSSPRLGCLSDLVLPAVSQVVAVAPHPDDEVLGAGGLLQVLAARGTSVDVCAVTDGEAAWGPPTSEEERTLRSRRADEAATALRRLGLDPRRRHRLGLPDGGGAANVEPLVRWLRDRVRADGLIVAPWSGERHPDHDGAGAAAEQVAAALGVPLLRYLVWTWHWAAPDGHDVPWATARRLRLSPRQTARKRRAVASFGSQIRSPDGRPDEQPVLPPEVLARFRRPWEVLLT